MQSIRHTIFVTSSFPIEKKSQLAIQEKHAFSHSRVKTFATIIAFDCVKKIHG